jgi:hypothetical protein
MNGEKIKKYLAELNEDGTNDFTNRIVNSKAVLPDLFKKYFVERLPDEVADMSTVSDDMFKEYFGEDFESSDPYFNIDKVLKDLYGHDTSLFDKLLANFKKNKMNDSELLHKLKMKKTDVNETDIIVNGTRDGDFALDRTGAEQFRSLWWKLYGREEKEQYPQISKPICTEQIRKNSWTGYCVEETYDDFKIRIRKKIAQLILDIKTHKYYGLGKELCMCREDLCDDPDYTDRCMILRPDHVAILEGKRPLKIMKRSQDFLDSDIKDIIQKKLKDAFHWINRDLQFTELHEEWWTEKEEELKKSLKENIHKEKLERLYSHNDTYDPYASFYRRR